MLENIGVTQAVNDMLLTSHGYGLRLFPIWAALRGSESASFTTLRGKGAFLVSAQYNGSTATPDTRRVRGVQITSEAGMQCRVLSPWGAATTQVTIAPCTAPSPSPASVDAPPQPASGQQAAGTAVVVVDEGGWFQWDTTSGACYAVAPVA
jgi:hypothetical protein